MLEPFKTKKEAQEHIEKKKLQNAQPLAAKDTDGFYVIERIRMPKRVRIYYNTKSQSILPINSGQLKRFVDLSEWA